MAEETGEVKVTVAPAGKGGLGIIPGPFETTVTQKVVAEPAIPASAVKAESAQQRGARISDVLERIGPKGP